MLMCETCPAHSGERIVLTHKGNNLCLDCFLNRMKVVFKVVGPLGEE